MAIVAPGDVYKQRRKLKLEEKEFQKGRLLKMAEELNHFKRQQKVLMKQLGGSANKAAKVKDMSLNSSAL